MAGCWVVGFCPNCYLDDMSLELHTFLFLAISVLHVQTCKQVASVHTNCDIEEVENQAPLVTHLGVGAGHRQNHLPNLHQIGTKLFPSPLKTLKKILQLSQLESNRPNRLSCSCNCYSWNKQHTAVVVVPCIPITVKPSKVSRLGQFL